jgi:sRNA-binding carbon storage regulator CsrA
MGGLETLVKDYLLNEMATLSEPPAGPEHQEVGWRLLKTLVTSQGTKAPRALEYVRQNADTPAEMLDTVMEQLLRKRVLRSTRAPSGERLIEIAHEILVAEIRAREAPAEIRRKVVWELLSTEFDNYEVHGVLMSAERLRILDAYGGDLPDLRGRQAVLRFLLLSSVQSNQPCRHWIEQADARILVEVLELAVRLLGKLGIRCASLGPYETPIDVMIEIRDRQEMIQLLKQYISQYVADSPDEPLVDGFELLNRHDLAIRAESLRLEAQRLRALESRLHRLEIQCSQYASFDVPLRIVLEMEEVRQEIDEAQKRVDVIASDSIDLDGLADQSSREYATQVRREALANKRAMLVRNRDLLQIRRARFGIHTPPHILIELEDLEQEIQRVSRTLNDLGLELTQDMGSVKEVASFAEDNLPLSLALISPSQRKEVVALITRWLMLEELAARYVTSEMPPSVSLELTEIRNKLDIQGEHHDVRQLYDLISDNLAPNAWRSSLNRQRDSLRRLLFIAQLAEAKYGYAAPVHLEVARKELMARLSAVEAKLQELDDPILEGE